MKNKLSLFAILGALIFLLISCQEESFTGNIQDKPLLPETPFDYTSVMDKLDNFVMPQTLNIQDQGVFNGCNFCPDPLPNENMAIDNNDEATLGRVLFYDKQLSLNNSIACASCHQQSKGFADNEVFSQGFGGKRTERNSMSIINPVVNNSFFWDSRESSLQELTLQPIVNHIEMGIISMDELSVKLSEIDYYRDLFAKAFGSDHIDANRISRALSQFTGSIFTNDSPFDEGINQNFANLSLKERHGMALFFSEKTLCSSCHSGINFSAPDGLGNEYEESEGTANIGLNVQYDDQGRNDGKFKIPSLRNIALTAPYMHDGRFSTLAEVLDHYNSGIQPHTHLDSKLRPGGSPLRMNLSDLELESLESFLVTLTSTSLTTEEKWSNPFQD